MPIAAEASSDSTDIDLPLIDLALLGCCTRLLRLVIPSSFIVAAGRICHPATELEKLGRHGFIGKLPSVAWEDLDLCAALHLNFLIVLP